MTDPKSGSGAFMPGDLRADANGRALPHAAMGPDGRPVSDRSLWLCALLTLVGAALIVLDAWPWLRGGLGWRWPYNGVAWALGEASRGVRRGLACSQVVWLLVLVLVLRTVGTGLSAPPEPGSVQMPLPHNFVAAPEARFADHLVLTGYAR